MMKSKLFISVFIVALLFSCTRRGGSYENNGNRTKIERRKQESSRKKQPEYPENNTSQKLTGEEIFDKCNPAVFRIFTTDGMQKHSGSGFFINENGLAVSNYHVFEGTDNEFATIKLSDDSRFKIKKVIAYSEEYDYIIFEVDIPTSCVYIPISNGGLKVGEKVYAIGSPMGWENTFSSGEISQIREGKYKIQINVPIDHGSSGGALINEYGEVIGITSAGVDESIANLNFAVDINVIKKHIDDYNSKTWSNSELKAANTAKNVTELTLQEREVIKFINLARLYPKRFVQVELLNPSKVELYQNSSYLKSLIEEMSNLEPLSPFYYDSNKQPFAECWAKESGKRGIVGHNRKGYCEEGYFAECCSYGYDKGEDIVIQLLVDFDVPDLGHRKALLGSYSKVGVSIAPHKKYKHCCVIDFI